MLQSNAGSRLSVQIALVDPTRSCKRFQRLLSGASGSSTPLLEAALDPCRDRARRGEFGPAAPFDWPFKRRAAAAKRLRTAGPWPDLIAASRPIGLSWGRPLERARPQVCRPPIWHLDWSARVHPISGLH